MNTDLKSTPIEKVKHAYINISAYCISFILTSSILSIILTYLLKILACVLNPSISSKLRFVDMNFLTISFFSKKIDLTLLDSLLYFSILLSVPICLYLSYLITKLFNRNNVKYVVARKVFKCIFTLLFTLLLMLIVISLIVPGTGAFIFAIPSILFTNMFYNILDALAMFNTIFFV
ncbi:MAG: hypothetical protein RR702_02845 [Clostridia bacterium]